MTHFGWVMVTFVAVIVFGTITLFRPVQKLIWNATASTPIGLYALQPTDDLHVGDLVSIMPPEPIASFLADGGFLPKGVPLLKRVLAISGRVVCRKDHTITVDGIAMGEARERDGKGRDLPVWQGCRKISASEIFVMNWQVPDSLDGRYFGPLPASSIVGRAMPLWTDENGDGRFEWHVVQH